MENEKLESEKLEKLIFLCLGCFLCLVLMCSFYYWTFNDVVYTLGQHGGILSISVAHILGIVVSFTKAKLF